MAELTAEKFIVPVLEFQRNLFPPFSYPAGDLADWFASEGGIVTLAWIYAVNIAFAVGMTNLILVIHLERKIAARIQDRRGPMLSLRAFRELGEDLAGEAPTWRFKGNYSGIGIIQNMADGIKAITKELIIPNKADKFLFSMGPIIFISSSVFLLVLFPLSDRFAASAAPAGLMVIMAAFSIAPIGVLTSGWASNNKYSMIGGMRSAAQLMSYEIPLLLSMAGVFLLAGSYNPVDIVEQQREATWLFGLPMWNFIPQFIGFIVFMICILAEVERVPFDLPEAEAELVEGWTTEYSGIRYMLFLAAEYIRGFAGAAVATILFLGGWAGPWPVPPEIWFLLKVYLIIIFWIFIRWTVPRIRTDQILELGWKKLLPLSLINILIVIFMVEIYPYFDDIVNLPEVF
ncbi:MAG: NADH-quinone oxidoreductase subunit H [Euryarchaeota archaeon]|nr:NADH-quinone oxidoreductase subunit H [Euryarchaeota archaeon]|tara:strand:+ start:1093 stop:2298 length:1206 start_codon:yes stop_codon:yes gene_type:complete